MCRGMLRALGVALATAQLAGCTFYTACPAGGNGTPNGNTSGASNGGGNASAGASGSGAGMNLAGAAPTGPWLAATGTLGGTKAGYANATYVGAKPDQDELIAGLSEVGLFSSTDGAATWTPLGTGKNSASIPHRTISIRFDPDDSKTFYVAGTYGPAFFKTTDGGKTFTDLGLVNGCEAFDVDFTDSGRKTIVGSAHEMGRIVWLTHDGGSSWTDIGPKLPADTSVCSYPVLIDAQTLLISCSVFNAPQHGIYRSTDAGDTWTQVSTTTAHAEALHASDGAYYWSIEGNAGMLKSEDKGLTWNRIFDSALEIPPIELPDGSIAASTHDYLVLSSDGGMTWRPVTSKLPFTPIGLTYSKFQKAFYIWQYGFADAVANDEIQRYDFDYEAP